MIFPSITYLYGMAVPDSYHLFVYGSLRSGFQSPAYEYISRFFTLIGEAKVPGNLVDLGPYPVGVPATDGHAIVGELYIIKNENEFFWAIAQLDDYEAVVVEAGETPLYKRELTEVYLKEQIIKAWIYWYNGDVEGKPVITSGDLIEYIRQKK